MSPTRWLIVVFWIAMGMLGLWYVFSAISAPPLPKAPERHWYPPPLPSSSAPAPSAAADVRLTHYVMKTIPTTTTFTADVTLENLGGKKATGVQVKIQPYVSGADADSAHPGPDEIPNQPNGDPLAGSAQWIGFPDLDPGQKVTQTLTFTMRNDASPAESQPDAKVQFQTVP